MERMLKFEETGYKNMAVVAKMLDALTGKGHAVIDTYLDYGQDWMWTTICREGGMFGPVQVLCPRDWKRIVNANTMVELAEIAEEIAK